MKKNLFLLIAAAACLLAACDKFAAEVPSKESSYSAEDYTLIQARNADASPATHSNIDGTTADFTWSTGDRIALYSGSWRRSEELESTYNATNSATFALPAGINPGRSDFAVYPASLVFDGASVRSASATDHSASALAITLPASYTLAEVQGDTAPTPMIATNAPDGDLEFKHIGALLRLTLNNVPKQTRAITFDFNGKKVQGDFTISTVTPGTSVVETSATAGDDDIITVLTPDIAAFTSDLEVNLPIPTGTYGDITVTTWDAASGGHKINSMTQPVKRSADWTPGRKAFGKRTVYLPVFSVSASKKVVLAPGMLQAVIATAPTLDTTPAVADHWQFASEQYEIVGNTSGNKFMEAGATIDLFCWVGASATVDSYGLITLTAHSDDFNGSVAGEGLKSDWGNLRIRDGVGEYEPNTWFTPTGSEWYYFGCTRTTETLNGVAKARYATAKVNGMFGVLMFPDHYEHPTGVALPLATSINHGNVETKWNDDPLKFTVYNLDDWKKMEAAGCAFLTATGLRQQKDGAPNLGSFGNTIYAMVYSMSASSDAGQGKTKQSNWSTASGKTYPNAYGGLRWNGKGVRLMRQVN